ncbi:MAG: hypothetical protein ACTHY4_08255 [Flavobacteriaceae bacterium]|nr:hypothetical protein [Psychroflexus sp.]
MIESDLTGHITTEKGERKNIKMNISGAFKVSCRVFIDDKNMTFEKIK